MLLAGFSGAVMPVWMSLQGSGWAWRRRFAVAGARRVEGIRRSQRLPGDLPELGEEQAEEAGVEGDAFEAGICEAAGVVGELRGSKTGEDAEAKIERADEEFCRKAEGTGRNAEVGDEPQGSGREGGGKPDREAVDLVLGETVQKEVGHDEVRRVDGREAAGVLGVDPETEICGGGGTDGSLLKQMEHGRAEIDGIGSQVPVLREETGEEAAIAVSEDESLPAFVEAWEIEEPATLERASEGETLQPEVGPGEAIEADTAAGQRSAVARKRSGVRRVRSAEARRVVRARRWRC